MHPLFCSNPSQEVFCHPVRLLNYLLPWLFLEIFIFDNITPPNLISKVLVRLDLKRVYLSMTQHQQCLVFCVHVIFPFQIICMHFNDKLRPPIVIYRRAGFIF